MPLEMKPNLETRGRWLRGVSGILVGALGAALLLAWAPTESAVTRFGVGGVLAAIGAFQILEALSGWCVVRAMGFRTPI
ncbi:MAG: DUF2892 domain-containing protein [Planctomycetota bacterium]|nr:MAG: DUF2892 domain-containing protein [Planctomycetota bacterium]